uniref:Uncharacterized protein n=1 Tax=Plectus sambesii TaxID=2011161 RepID=A0A914VFW8_9BILA
MASTTAIVEQPFSNVGTAHEQAASMLQSEEDENRQSRRERNTNSTPVECCYCFNLTPCGGAEDLNCDCCIWCCFCHACLKDDGGCCQCDCSPCCDGCDCGDCNCGDCGDCNCGDCNCDCGGCSIM